MIAEKEHKTPIVRGWKGIAAYLGLSPTALRGRVKQDERLARVIMREPGSKKQARIYAFVEDLNLVLAKRPNFRRKA